MSAGEFKFRIVNWASLASSVAAILVAMAAGITSGFGVGAILDRSIQKPAGAAAISIVELRTLARQQSADIEVFRKQIEQLSNLPADTKMAVRLARLEQEQANLSARQKQIEDSVVDTPEKALSLPLLRQDLDNLKQGQEIRIGAVLASVDRIYDLNKWLLGSMALAVISLALGNFFTRRDQRANKPEGD